MHINAFLAAAPTFLIAFSLWLAQPKHILEVFIYFKDWNPALSFAGVVIVDSFEGV